MHHLDKSDQMKDAAEIIKTERKRIIENFEKYDAFTVFDSKANFVLFDAKGADKRVFSALVEQGISIRKLGKIGSHSGCLTCYYWNQRNEFKIPFGNS